MIPETLEQIKALPEMTDEAAKLIFIRSQSEKSYFEDKLRENFGIVAKELIELGTVASVSRDTVGIHIANLELAREYLSALLQGIKIAHAKTVEPKIRAKREKELKDQVLSKASGLGKLGIDLAALNSRLSQVIAESNASSNKTAPTSNNKEICPKCSKGTILKFHRC